MSHTFHTRYGVRDKGWGAWICKILDVPKIHPQAPCQQTTILLLIFSVSQQVIPGQKEKECALCLSFELTAPTSAHRIWSVWMHRGGAEAEANATFLKRSVTTEEKHILFTLTHQSSLVPSSQQLRIKQLAIARLALWIWTHRSPSWPLDKRCNFTVLINFYFPTCILPVRRVKIGSSNQVLAERCQ